MEKTNWKQSGYFTNSNEFEKYPDSCLVSSYSPFQNWVYSHLDTYPDVRLPPTLTEACRPGQMSHTKPASSSLPLSVFHHVLFLFGWSRSYWQCYVVGSETVTGIDVWMHGLGTRQEPMWMMHRHMDSTQIPFLHLCSKTMRIVRHCLTQMALEADTQPEILDLDHFTWLVRQWYIYELMTTPGIS